MDNLQGLNPGTPSPSMLDQQLREMNEALLLSSIHQHELAEQARNAEAVSRQRELKLESRTAELDRFNRLAVGRESRILDLKKALNELASRLGEPTQFRTDFAGLDPADGPACAVPPSSKERQAARARDDIAPLEAVLRTGELELRPSREPDCLTENRALLTLIQSLTEDPDTVLKQLTQTVLEVLHAGSAGISLLTADGDRFYWPEIHGAWRPYIGGGTPRDFGPCGDVLDRDAPQLFQDPANRYFYFRPVTPPVREALLVPFHVQGSAVGTIWAVMHDDARFDKEDLRQLENFGKLAATAFQAARFLELARSRGAAALNLMEDAVQSRQAVESINEGLRKSEERYRTLFAERSALEEKTRHQAQALAELNQRKDEFLAMLSHELRNPLTAILNAERVLDGQQQLNPVQVQAHGILHRQVGQLCRLVDDLLEVSRITTGRIHMRMERVDLCGIIDMAVGAIRAQARARGLELTNLHGESPVWIDGDPVRLEQVLANLLNNAIKYTDSGGIAVQLALQGGEAVLSVSDTGVGIAPEMLPRIFEMFAQVQDSLGRSQGGLGIGLSLVQTFVALHGGRVEVHSEPGKGSSFIVRLPVLS